MTRREQIHERVLNAESQAELADAYGEWAEQYDADLIGEMGYVAPIISGQLLLSYLQNTGARILDAGCGTGLAGAYLRQQGFVNLHGLDYSTEMLARAREKNIYRSLSWGDLTRNLDQPDDHYDAIICVGTLTCGHVGPEAFAELIRITKPGGLICFTVREKAWDEDNYAEAIEAIAQRHDWTVLESKTADYIKQEGSTCKVCVCRKPGPDRKLNDLG